MIPFRRILVPVALSPACAWAARYATRLAPQLSAEVTFLHVTDQASHGLEKFLASQIPGAVYRSVILNGDSAERIVTFAQESHCDLILMPTHSYGRFRRFLLGSVTAKVLHDASCAVWTGVHHQDAPTPDDAAIHSIVCAVDRDQTCVEVIRSAQKLASCFNAAVKLVHAVPAADETSDNPGEMEVRRYLFRRAKDESRLCVSPRI